MDAEDLGRRADLPVRVRQHARDVAGLDLREREQAALGPVRQRGFLAANLVRQVLGAQRVVVRDDDAALNHVAQLAHVPDPRVAAPVNAPFSWPKSSLSRRFSGMAAQFTATNAPEALGPCRCTARATTSLPVPDSP